MTNSRMNRGDITAPTTPEQYAAALARQERVISDLRKRLEMAESQLKVIYIWARNDAMGEDHLALDPDHVMKCCAKGLGEWTCAMQDPAHD